MIFSPKLIFLAIFSVILFGFTSIAAANSSREVVRSSSNVIMQKGDTCVTQQALPKELRVLRKQAKKDWKIKRREVRKQYRADLKANKGDAQKRKEVRKEYRTQRKELRKERRSLRKIRTLEGYKSLGLWNGAIKNCTK